MDDNFKTTSPIPEQQQLPKGLTYLFLDAMKFVQEGRKITRVEWDNPEVYGFLWFDSSVNNKILALHKDDDKIYQWIIVDGDLFADDWIVLEEGN